MQRRIIFLLVATVLVVFLYLPFRLHMPADPEVRRYFDAIEALQGGDTVALVTEYSPSTEGEQWNMHENTLYHLFARGIRIIHLSTWEFGPDIAAKYIRKVQKIIRDEGGIERKPDIDYVELRYSSGYEIVMVNAATSIAAAFPRNRQGLETKDLPIMQGVRGLAADPATGERKVKLLISLASGVPGTREWIRMVGTRYGVPVLAGVTSAMAPDLYPFMKSGQLRGLLSGLPGGFQYETLLREAGIRRTPSGVDTDMSIQSAMHCLVIGLVVVGNISYFLARRRRGRP